MEDTLKNRITPELKGLIEATDNAKGKETTVLYIGEISSFAEFMLITTATSAAHIRGIIKELKGFCSEHDLYSKNGFKGQDGWSLLDMGDIVVHVMDSESRDFYDLENRWFDGEVVFKSEE